ncbi:MAG: sulfite exporter TauE/SafE family protein [Oligoflexia bacterium]|nr:sulfite exporter TauE/SafE family protein [Oligoflexia bacterium]
MKVKSNIPWSITKVIGIPGFITALLAVQIYVILPPAILVFIYAAVMFICLDLVSYAEYGRGIRMKVSKRLKKYYVKYIVIGIVAGLLASLLGIGGGIVIYPMLIKMAQHETKEALKISVIVMVSTSLAGIIGHSAYGNIPYVTGIYLGIGAIIGSFLANISQDYISEKTINKWIKICLLDMCIIMLFKAFFV